MLGEVGRGGRFVAQDESGGVTDGEEPDEPVHLTGPVVVRGGLLAVGARPERQHRLRHHDERPAARLHPLDRPRLRVSHHAENLSGRLPYRTGGSASRAGPSPRTARRAGEPPLPAPVLPQPRTRAALHDLQLGVDPAPQIGDMADDAHAAVAFAQGVQDVQHLVEGLVVEAAEALVDEEGVEPDAARLVGDDVRETEREGERGEEGLAAREGRGVALPCRSRRRRRAARARCGRGPARSSEWTRV